MNTASEFSFHNKLKNHSRYLDHKPNRRLDDLIHTLLKYKCDMFMSKQTKQVWCMQSCRQIITSHVQTTVIFKIMKTSADASERLDGKRHDNGMKIDDDAVKGRILAGINTTQNN